MDALCGYMMHEFDSFMHELARINRNDESTYVTTHDLLLKTNRVPSIITSGAKGTKDHLTLLFQKLTDHDTTLKECESEMIELNNKYITSNQELSRNGRNQFVSLYACNDLVAMMGRIYLNKVLYADYQEFASCATFMWSRASLELFADDLFAL